MLKQRLSQRKSKIKVNIYNYNLHVFDLQLGGDSCPLLFNFCWKNYKPKNPNTQLQHPDCIWMRVAGCDAPGNTALYLGLHSEENRVC